MDEVTWQFILVSSGAVPYRLNEESKSVHSKSLCQSKEAVVGSIVTEAHCTFETVEVNSSEPECYICAILRENRATSEGHSL